tara:strand:+ start:2582 stop:2824 length:243 start_codon:yes stop_codon:yes gene_type:complete
MADKLGVYVEKLMTTVLDKEQDDFVRQLAWDELSRLKVDIESFLKKNCFNEEDEDYVKTMKKLLLEKQETQEDTKDVNNK